MCVYVNLLRLRSINVARVKLCSTIQWYEIINGPKSLEMTLCFKFCGLNLRNLLFLRGFVLCASSFIELWEIYLS